MNNLCQPASHEERIEYLILVLEAVEKRRDSVENKSAVLIAANAILLSAIISLGIPQLTDAVGVGMLIRVVITIIVLSAIILSTLWSAQILMPLATQKQRSQIMDLGPDPDKEHNLFLFVRISKMQKAEYRKAIESLTQEEIADQLISEVHNLSRLLDTRYRAMRRSHGAFVFALVAFAALAILEVLP